MVKQYLLKTELFGYEICVHALRLDEGMQVHITGGSRTHIGAVSFIGYDGVSQTIQLPGHKDGYVSTRWANVLWENLHEPVCIQCGIHYDRLESSQIKEVLNACDELMNNFLKISNKKG